jgi:hypothetical protein
MKMHHGHKSFLHMIPRQGNTLVHGIHVRFLHKFLPFSIVPFILAMNIITEDYGKNQPLCHSFHRCTWQYGGFQMEKFDNCRAQGISSDPHEYGNEKSYWERENSFFLCSTISNIMTRERFKELVRYLHITNPDTYTHIARGTPVMTK